MQAQLLLVRAKSDKSSSGEFNGRVFEKGYFYIRCPTLTGSLISCTQVYQILVDSYNYNNNYTLWTQYLHENLNCACLLITECHF